jgi:flagellar M-ring protein FliF
MLGMLSFTKDDVMNLIEMVVVLLLGLVVVFMVVRPLVKRILSADPAPAPAIPAPVPALAESQPPPSQSLVPSNATSQMIDVAQVQGQVHAQSVHRVGELADRNPSETVSIIRQWLSEPA